MWLLVGLGNPGDRYVRDRHNVGFMAVDALAQAHGFPEWRQSFQALVSRSVLDKQHVLAMKPVTWMNESGRAVGEAVRFFKISPENIFVFHDDLDLDPGRVKVKKGGGAAGHNGLRSLISHIGEDFYRVRIGIGHPGHKDLVHNYVLGRFSQADMKGWLPDLLTDITRELPWLLRLDTTRFLSEIARHSHLRKT